MVALHSPHAHSWYRSGPTRHRVRPDRPVRGAAVASGGWRAAHEGQGRAGHPVAGVAYVAGGAAQPAVLIHFARRTAASRSCRISAIAWCRGPVGVVQHNSSPPPIIASTRWQAAMTVEWFLLPSARPISG